MKKIELRSRKFLRKIFNGVSLTAVAFIFQACYGPGPDMSYDVKLTGTVTSKTTNLPIKGIKVATDDGHSFVLSDDDGKFDFYVSVREWDHETNSKIETLNVHFKDIDGEANGHFADQTRVVEPAYKNEVNINVELEDFVEKE